MVRVSKSANFLSTRSLNGEKPRECASHLQVAVLVDEDVGGFQITVDDTSGMHVFETTLRERKRQPKENGGACQPKAFKTLLPNLSSHASAGKLTRIW